MVITEVELREMWRDGRNPLPAFPPGTRFSPSAQDFIKDHQLEIRFADSTPELVSVPQLPGANGPLPASLDTLHALTLLVAAEARRYRLAELARRLDALAAYCGELRAAEQQGRDPTPLTPPLAASGAPAFTAAPTDHAIVHWLNLLRASAGQATAQAAGTGNAKLAAGLWQVSASAAELGRRVQAGELGWNLMGSYSNR
jgi:hypothetical protein